MTGNSASRMLLSLVALLFLCGQTARAGLAAMASYTYTQSGSTYTYDMTLNNTGSTTIGTFWFAWVPGNGFMSVMPTNITSPSGWTEMITNSYAIQWVTPSPYLASGSVLSGFNFDSTLTPAQIDAIYTGGGIGSGTDPVATSFVYSKGPFSDSGFQFVVSDVGQAPEPSSFLLAGSAFLGVLGRAWWRRRSAAAQLSVSG